MIDAVKLENHSIRPFNGAVLSLVFHAEVMATLPVFQQHIGGVSAAL
jgi:hypothetical protein